MTAPAMALFILPAANVVLRLLSVTFQGLQQPSRMAQSEQCSLWDFGVYSPPRHRCWVWTYASQINIIWTNRIINPDP